jgi:hypothetical protein
MKHEKPKPHRSEADEQGQHNYSHGEETIMITLDDGWCRNIDNQGDDKCQGSPR